MLKDIRRNPIMLTDAYNLSHQHLKVNTDWEVSHIYNRKEGMILYGFSEIVESVLNIQLTHEMVDEAVMKARKMGLTFPTELFRRVVDEFNGYMPILVECLPEGTWVPKGTPFAQIRNTAKGFGELVTWLEGIFLHSAFPCGAATEAFFLRRYLENLMKTKGFDKSFLIRLHSFGFRGHRSLEDAYWAGTAWNLFLFGTDDFHTMIHTINANMGSISALAHKVTQQYDVEFAGYIHTVDATNEKGEKIVAIVIDTYDANRFIREYLVPVANYAKTFGIHVVIRPDSGDIRQQVIDIYKKVEQYGLANVSVIIGENMSFANVKQYDWFFEANGVPLTFVSYGIGGGFYNHINRDTLGFAMKTAFSNGKPRMKFGMDALKRSIPDKVVVFKNEDGLLAVEREKVWMASGDKIQNLYEKIYQHDSRFEKPFVKIADWDETQARALQYIDKDLQDRIVLSEGINELVKEFEATYA